MPDNITAGAAPDPKMAIIGRLPGYNTNIDKNGQFASQLLKGLTFIDMIPTTYNIGDSAKGADDIIGTLMSKGTLFQHKTGDPIITGNFQTILKNMAEGLGMDAGFADVESLRIIGANDSTYTESFSNNFDGKENSVSGMMSGVQNSKLGALGKKVVGGIKSMSYERAVDTLTSATSSSLIGEMFTGSMTGINFSVPSPWTSSSYTTSLNMFIKLVSPSGGEACIQKNIIAPLLYLLGASAPITMRGFAYGYPMLWDVHAHGIARYKVAAITSMTISRGSFETTFNNNYQPTIIDVRLNISSLVNDFALPFASSKLYNDTTSLGTVTPGDIYAGAMNRMGTTKMSTKEIKIIQL